MRTYKNDQGLEVNDLSGNKTITQLQKDFGGINWQEVPPIVIDPLVISTRRQQSDLEAEALKDLIATHIAATPALAAKQAKITKT